MANWRRAGLLVLLIAVFGDNIIHAAGEGGEPVMLTVGRSTIVDTGKPISRVSLTSADVADALVTSTNELLINGKMPGTISMFVWDRAGAIKRYEVVVQRDLAILSQQLKDLFPGESIVAHSSGRSIVLAGTVTSKEAADRAVSVAAGYVEKKEDVVPLMQVQARASSQVLLHVRFAEVSRSALTELGATFFTSNNGYKEVVGRVTTEQFPSLGFTDRIGPPPDGDPNKEGKMAFADFLNLFLFSTKYQVGTLIRVLQTKGLFQSLAEPNLVAESGKEASFLAGGEIPVPIAQGTGGNVAITVQWKEFGVRLNFTPTVNGDRVNLKVRPEVSTLDFANAVVLQGFRIPALSSRRAETEVELMNNQTFAIAGLLNNQATKTLQKIPGIGDIPILGLLFQSQAAQKNQTELVVMITPEILPPGSSGATTALPRQVEPYMPPPDPKKSFPAPPPAFQVPSGAADATAPAPAAAVPAPRPQPEVKASTRASETPKVDAKAHAAETKRQARAADEAKRKAAEDAKRAAEQKKRDDKAAAEKAEREQKAAREQAERETKSSHEQSEREAKAAHEQAARDAKAAQEQAARDGKAAHEKALRDAEAAKRQAEIDKVEQEAAARRAAELQKKQTEEDKRQQKSIDEAQARLKAAQAALDAELAKKTTRQQ